MDGRTSKAVSRGVLCGSKLSVFKRVERGLSTDHVSKQPGFSLLNCSNFMVTVVYIFELYVTRIED
jgi:hypothetical protein